ncbi:NAD-dependent epimerase/dehydratase family protein [Rhodoplanes sp. TEM]|uniref:NAD-dependent epimerase/dehydratase family protein n=1 Tax=Rhodoplanes tepidamans TaxID=200616 RepID=A0ABT5JK14_RHOTP|nr:MULTISPECIES: NAD-dependent epimerase/dehydratase family protein [Rhodoplanes]MDC7790059.1 NAD-dependent epimerase/dehydratase family protein [Rhodoplanes tepidamans]MDC7988142.1 NAD-dependent epimerase/dehydratase family protein [Rhodoplanes sp. TEM]MDQ0359099.1 nucleoside-diphosphate-sugar epimerase [Rhodoplanes tepidamans]
MARTAVVCGAGGFIGSHLVKRLRREGYWVRGVDLKVPEFAPTAADDFRTLDLRDPDQCERALRIPGGVPDEVYQLAADMGGMGFIHGAECEIMHNNVLINVHMTHAAARLGVPRYFYSSSVCVYRDMRPGEPEMAEDGAYPALPDNEYGWEKLYSERIALAYARRTGMAVRIARFQNCYGPEGTWQGGREKAPAAICRKVACAPDGGEVEVWGDGTAVRSYTYVDDMVDGIFRLTQSHLEGPVNIGNPEYVTVDELVAATAATAGKRIRIRHVDGPVGVQSRNFSNARIESLGWRAAWPLRRGIAATYSWIATQVDMPGVRIAV